MSYVGCEDVITLQALSSRCVSLSLSVWGGRVCVSVPVRLCACVAVPVWLCLCGCAGKGVCHHSPGLLQLSVSLSVSLCLSVWAGAGLSPCPCPSVSVSVSASASVCVLDLRCTAVSASYRIPGTNGARLYQGDGPRARPAPLQAHAPPRRRPHGAAGQPRP
eukprot:3518952-Rhodomonas_salina.1